MKDQLSLDDLSLFAAVAEAGGLAGALATTGQSAPTLSRKMTALERRLGRRLFLRGPKGYALTADGRALLAQLEPLAEVRRHLSRWVDAAQTYQVRITAGRWTARWLVQNLHHFWSAQAPWRPEFVASNALLDIARREADFGFRNARPDQTWLAARQTREINYAEYATSDAVGGYVALPEAEAATRSTRWVRQTHGDRIATTVNDAILAMEMARQGMARVVLPTFVGDLEPGLLRVSEPIAALTHGEWLVTHHDARHDPPVRRALDAIAEFVSKSE